MIQLWLIILIELLTIPTAYFLYKLTQDEKEIYKKYFPAILWILAITTAIFLKINTLYALTTETLFLVIVIWNYFDKIKAKLSEFIKKL